MSCVHTGIRWYKKDICLLKKSIVHAYKMWEPTEQRERQTKKKREREKPRARERERLKEREREREKEREREDI